MAVGAEVEVGTGASGVRLGRSVSVGAEVAVGNEVEGACAGTGDGAGAVAGVVQAASSSAENSAHKINRGMDDRKRLRYIAESSLQFECRNPYWIVGEFG